MSAGDRAFVIYRVLCRLNEQAALAWQYNRLADAQRLGELIGRLEYQHFACPGFEYAGRAS